MGTQLGYFSDDGPVDYPELNKCPDCETFFAAENCPICGKLCPEEMRAGNRKKVKQPKKRKRSGTGRVQFVPWYLTTPVILVALVVQPIIGLILLWMGYWKKGWKIAATVVFALWFFAAPILLGLGNLILNGFYKPPVNLDDVPPKEEYVEMCTPYQGKELYRLAGDEAFLGGHAQIQLTVEGEWIDSEDVSGYNRYYRCYAEENGQRISFLVHDYRQTNRTNLMAGDVIVVYGQIEGNVAVPQGGTFVEEPCIGMLYMTLQ